MNGWPFIKGFLSMISENLSKSAGTDFARRWYGMRMRIICPVFRGEVIQIFRMQCPLVLVSTGKNTEDEKGEIGALFQEAFRRYLKAMKDTPGWKERTMVYGRLKICRQSRKIYLDEENIELSGWLFRELNVTIPPSGYDSKIWPGCGLFNTVV